MAFLTFAAARNAVITSVVADVVRAYVDLRGFQTQVGILRNASEVLQESLRIVNIRFERGIQTGLLHGQQVRQDLENLV